MHSQGTGSIHVFRVSRQGRARENSSTSTTTVMSSAGLSTRSRTSLSAETKRHICEDHERHPKMTQEAIAKRYGCKRTTVAKIIKGKERWLAIDPRAALAKRLRQRNTRYPLVEDALRVWIEQRHAQSTPVTDQMLQEKARQYAADACLAGAEEFKASSSWLASFKQRYMPLKQPLPTDDPAPASAPTLLHDTSHSRPTMPQSQFVFPVILDPAQPSSSSPSSPPSPGSATPPSLLPTSLTPEQLLDYLHRPSSSTDSPSTDEKIHARQGLERALAYYASLGPTVGPSAQLVQLLLQHDF